MKKIMLPGSENYWHAYERGEDLDTAFPGQDASDFAIAVEYNGSPEELKDVAVVALVCVQFGANDDEGWVWHVDFADGSKWVVEGWCDYTGWDCQSGLDWTLMS